MTPLWPGPAPPIPQGYERGLVPALMLPCARELVARVPIAAGARVLDVASGTGAVARMLAARARVVGVDAWDEMPRLARSLVPGVAWAIADLQALPFRAASFDAALCQHGLAFAEEPQRALAEMRRVVRPGGAVAVLLWTGLARSPGFAALGASVTKRLGEERAPVLRFPHALETEAGLEGLFAEAGLPDARVHRLRIEARFRDAEDFVRAYVEGSYLAETIHQASAEAQRGLVADIEEAMAGWSGPEGLVFPVEAHLAVASVASSGRQI
jgi:SAM-dependent methyltransferase